MSEAKRIQLHLELPYKIEPQEDRRVKRYLERGFRIAGLQRVSDREALVTFDPPDDTGAGA